MSRNERKLQNVYDAIQLVSFLQIPGPSARTLLSVPVIFTTMHSTHRDASIDSLRRNPTDGAYHCPRCDAPFTRRSNLRRHYHIHTRNMVHKCQICNQIFAKSEELQSHSMQCGSHNTSWDHQTSRIVQAMAHYTTDNGLQQNIEFNGGLGIVTSPMHESLPGLPDDFNHVDLFQGDSLKQEQHNTQDFQDFFSSISSSFSEGSSSPSTSSEAMFGSSSYPFPYATQRGGSSSSSGSPSPPASTIFQSGYLVGPEDRANSINRWNKQNMMLSSLDKRTVADKPVYTRRQVEEMLDVVGNTFLNTIDAVIQRTQAGDLPLGQEIAELQALTGSHGGAVNLEARRMILVETIPRLVATLREETFGGGNHSLPS